MTAALYLAEQLDYPVGTVFTLDGPEGRHAAVVKRARVGEEILVADGLGKALRCQVESVAKSSLDLLVLEELHTKPKPHKFVAVQALAKGDRSDIAIEAMTELGVDEVLAWQASRSIVRWEHKKEKGLVKWQQTLRQATKQSRRFQVPESDYLTTDQVVARIKAADLALVLHESAETWLPEIPLPSSGEILFIIGPEGGISEEELAEFAAHGAKPVLLSDAVLRASTAGVVALAQLQALLGEQNA